MRGIGYSGGRNAYADGQGPSGFFGTPKFFYGGPGKVKRSTMLGDTPLPNAQRINATEANIASLQSNQTLILGGLVALGVIDLMIGTGLVSKGTKTVKKQLKTVKKQLKKVF